MKRLLIVAAGCLLALNAPALARRSGEPVAGHGWRVHSAHRVHVARNWAGTNRRRIHGSVTEGVTAPPEYGPGPGYYAPASGYGPGPGFGYGYGWSGDGITASQFVGPGSTADNPTDGHDVSR